MSIYFEISFGTTLTPALDNLTKVLCLESTDSTIYIYLWNSREILNVLKRVTGFGPCIAHLVTLPYTLLISLLIILLTLLLLLERKREE